MTELSGVALPLIPVHLSFRPPAIRHPTDRSQPESGFTLTDRNQKKPKDKPQKAKGKRNKSTNRTPKVMSAPAKKVEDSPFAVLEQLKQSNEKS